MPDLRDRMQQRAGQATEQRTLRDLTRQAAAQETAAVDNLADVPIDRLICDPQVQVRVHGIDLDKVDQYATVMDIARDDGEPYPFPPIVVFRERGQLYLADGFHRVEAARAVGYTALAADLRPGGLQGAIEYAEEANLAHGISLSNEDKKNILGRRLARGAWSEQTSNREIGRAFGVSHTTVSRWIAELSEMAQQQGGTNAPVSEKRATASGALMDVSGIQKANKKRAPTRLQLKQRALKNLESAVECLFRLNLVDQGESLEMTIEELRKAWDL